MKFSPSGRARKVAAPASAPIPHRSRGAGWRAGAVAITVVSAMALAGCASGGDSGGAVRELTLWISTSTEQQAGYDAIAADYEKETGVAVKIVNIPYEGYSTKLRSAAQANALPDVARVPGLDPIWTSKAVDLSSIVNDKATGINKDLIVEGSDGKVLSIPSDVTAAGMFINKTLFDKAGVAYPTDPAATWTWEEYIAAADKVRESAGAKYDLVFDASPSRLRAFSYEMGSNFVTQGDDGKFVTNSKTADALKLFKSMNDDTIMPKSVWTSGADPNALFKSGQVVGYFSGVWQIADFTANIKDFEWASVPAPAQPTHATDVNFGGLSVAFNNSESRGVAAKKFVEFMYAPANYTKLSEINGFLPVETGLTITYPFTEAAAIDGFALYNKEILAADPVSSYFARAQIEWALGGKSVATDPTGAEMAKFINGQQDEEATIKAILAGFDQQVGGK